MPEFRDFYYPSSTGKNEIRARICTPDGAPRGIVQIAHGIAEHINRYEDFITRQYQGRVMIVEKDNLDFENRPEDLAQVTDRIDRLLYGLFPNE